MRNAHVTHEALLAAFRENLALAKSALHECAAREEWEGVASCARAVAYWRKRLVALAPRTIVTIDGVDYNATIETGAPQYDAAPWGIE